VDRAALDTDFAAHIVTETRVAWDSDARAVRARVRDRLGALVLRDAPLANPDPDAVAAALLNGIREQGARALPWTESVRQLQARADFLRQHDASWPDWSDAALLDTMEEWLAPSLHGVTTLDGLQRLDLSALLLQQLSWQQRNGLETRAPSHYEVPTGSRIALDYTDPTSPVLAVRLQELFGVAETPRIDGGRVALTIHLLSPARRPVQVTRDLAGFWRGSYFEVKKELKGRYPKHVWPDDPLSATPTRRTKGKSGPAQP
jgi:ATP-dependent helicase HrpB